MDARAHRVVLGEKRQAPAHQVVDLVQEVATRVMVVPATVVPLQDRSLHLDTSVPAEPFHRLLVEDLTRRGSSPCEAGNDARPIGRQGTDVR